MSPLLALSCPGRVRRRVRSWRKPTPHSKAHPLINRLNLGLSEQIGPGLGEANKRSTLVHHQLAAFDLQLQTSVVTDRPCVVFEHMELGAQPRQNLGGLEQRNADARGKCARAESVDDA